MGRNYLNKGLGWSSSIEKAFFSRVYVPKLGRKNWPIVDWEGIDFLK